MRHLLDKYLDSFRELPRDVWALSSIMFVNRAGTMVLTFMALYLTRELGHSLTFAGQVLSVYGMGHLLGAWLGGWLTDRIGSLRVQIGSLVISGALFIVLGQVHEPGLLLVVVFALAVVAEALRPANGAALGGLTPPRLRARAWALNRIALNLGFAVGPAVGGWLATINYELLFVVDGLTCIAAGLLLSWLFRGRLDAAETMPQEESVEAGLVGNMSPWRDHLFLGMLAVQVLLAIAFLQAWSTYPLYLSEHYGINESRFGLLLLINAVMILTLEMPITKAIEALSPLRVVGVGALLVGVSYSFLLLGSGDNLTLVVVSLVVLTVGEMLSLPASGAWVSNRSGAERRGAYMGLFIMSWGVAWTVAPLTGTWVYEHLGGQALWLGILGVGCASFLGCWLIARVDER